MTGRSGSEAPDGEVQSAPRRRRRAVGPAGAAAPGVAGPVAPLEERPAEDDDERLLREVPPHHGG